MLAAELGKSLEAKKLVQLMRIFTFTDLYFFCVLRMYIFDATL